MWGDALLIAACASAVGGSTVLRHSWALPKRSAAWNGAGWGLFALSAVLGWWSAGAWGVSVAALCAMVAAYAILAQVGIVTPVKAAGKASNRRVGAMPERGEPWHLGRRIVTFLIVVVLAWIVSIGLALASHKLLAALGAAPADAIVAAFFVLPLAWGLLAFFLLMEERRVAQWRLLGVTALPGLAVLVMGLAA